MFLKWGHFPPCSFYHLEWEVWPFALNPFLLPEDSRKSISRKPRDQFAELPLLSFREIPQLPCLLPFFIQEAWCIHGLSKCFFISLTQFNTERRKGGGMKTSVQVLIRWITGLLIFPTSQSHTVACLPRENQIHSSNGLCVPWEQVVSVIHGCITCT